jgi:hypothetical protein
MIKLTATQRELLACAAAAHDGAIGPPKDRKTFAHIIKSGLAISVPQGEGGSRLLITEAGRAAIEPDVGKQPSGDEPASPPPEPEPAPAALAAPPKGKIGVLVALLRRPEGVTVDAMVAATGWQAHSVRGAMSGAVKKGLGLTIESEKIDGGRVYRITGEAEA